MCGASHLAKAELLRGAKRAHRGLDPAEQSTALQDLLLQSHKVVNVANGVAAMTVCERTIWGVTLLGGGCWEGKQESNR